MVEIYEGALDTKAIIAAWYDKYKNINYGAFITFVGIVRDENGVEGLSFDIYEPILAQWFDEWQEKAKGAKILMAHSRGDVANHETSFIAAVASPKRRAALELIDEFVEDFKKKAPIWKYDIKNGERVYAKERSTKLLGAGLLE
ncbi:MAG: molybdenum cofactor biosynthesis protein MoaE [Campylobacteraceae bacterium]|jgi:molybdopterin synthase catalytic subunit|nr:molybdenum cofactor biosynthesis protein MoaE [Campylobacteraceae bacterium]